VFSAITTERLILRRLRTGDAEPMFQYRSNPVVAKYQDWIPDSVEQTREFINSTSGIELDTPDTWFQLALVHRDSDRLIGDCGLHFFSSERRQAEIGITLATACQRQGYASEAVQAVLAFLFVELGKHRVFASVDPRNSAAIALFERVGMRKEAHFVENLWWKGMWVDDVIFAMLEREWRSRQEERK
jgi:RimJ/RimL family protein N-acetyltransferase